MRTASKPMGTMRPGYPVPDFLRILLVEDRPADRERITGVLRAEGLWDEVDCYHVWDAEHALELLASHAPELVVCDRYLGETVEGSQRVIEVAAAHPARPRLLLLSASSEFQEPTWFSSFLPKNGRQFDRMLVQVTRRLLDERPELEPVAKQRPKAFGRILGDSPALLESIRTAAKLAVRDMPILLRGETGTGKELFARAVHSASDRGSGPFVAINCSAIQPSLAESEFFGHKRGAFTGADSDRAGAFAKADGGTLFLDEIGELQLEVQSKLLRALAQGEVQRVGDDEPIQVDVRLVFATHVDLEQAIADGSFREDFFYRISAGAVGIPPLRERGNDIALLADALLESKAREMGRPCPELLQETREELMRRPWPGNVRELENTLARLLAMHDGRVVRPADLDETRRGSGIVKPLGLLEEVQADFKALGAGEPPRVTAMGLHGWLVLANGVKRLRAPGSGVANAGEALSQAYAQALKVSTFNAFVSVHGGNAMEVVLLALKEGLSLQASAERVLKKRYSGFEQADAPLALVLAECRRVGTRAALEAAYPSIDWAG